MFGSDQWLSNPASGFYNGVATQSLRFDQDSSTYLTRTPSSAGDKKTWTWSGWIKRASLISGSPYSGFGIIFAGGNEQNMWAIPANCTMIAYWINTEQLVVLGSGNTVLRQTSARQRDLSAWYHFVVAMDTTQGTANDRTKVYINGVQQTSFDTTNNVSQNTDLNINETSNHLIGGQQTANSGSYMNMYLAETNFVDGTALDASYFGETKNGVWIPKKYTGSYGTNGFRLQFNQTGTGTASASTIGADTSGNTNHWTSSGIVASDCDMPDSPENNFATLNPLNGLTGITYSVGNIKMTGSASNNALSSMAVSSGKYYFEVYSADNGGSGNLLVGIIDTSAVNAVATLATNNGTYRSNGVITNLAGSAQTAGATYGTGNYIGVAVDVDAGTVQFYKDNVAQGATPSFSFTANTEIVPHIRCDATDSIAVINFGQDPTFAKIVSAGTATGTGAGVFRYAPPSGFLALCTSNLPEPTIGANSDTQADDHFNTVLYTGTGSSNAITGVGFQPDWTWIKRRSGNPNAIGNGHNSLYDSTRGVTNELYSDLTSGEADNNNSLTAFGTDGFTVGSEARVNANNETHVAWNWKANGGTTSSNTDGSITSTVQANTDAGFSIVSYTGTGSGATIGHGLSSALNMVIIKNRDQTDNWAVGQTDIGFGNHLQLNVTDASTSASAVFNATAPTSTVFSVGTNHKTNASSEDYIAYCFHSVEGYSKFGSFKGNASADGTFVYTGFKPAYILMKNTTITTPWYILDNRIGNGEGNTTPNKFLVANTSGVEDSPTGADFLSNGFKIRTTGQGQNGSNELIIYMAFSEQTFKYANAK